MYKPLCQVHEVLITYVAQNPGGFRGRVDRSSNLVEVGLQMLYPTFLWNFGEPYQTLRLLHLHSP